MLEFGGNQFSLGSPRSGVASCKPRLGGEPFYYVENFGIQTLSMPKVAVVYHRLVATRDKGLK